MSAKSATGSAASSVQNRVISSDVENQLRSEALRDRLRDKTLSHGTIEIYLRCSNLAAIGQGIDQPFSLSPSLPQINLTGVLKLESIPKLALADCRFLVSVVFGEHSNITSLGAGAFQQYWALTSITLPKKLKIIEELAYVPSELPRNDKEKRGVKRRETRSEATSICRCVASLLVSVSVELTLFFETTTGSPTALPSNASSATKASRLSARTHSNSAQCSKMSSSHPA